MPEQVVVFAPSPGVSVTVEELDGRPDVHLHAGGQGVWQARMITALGARATLCCACGGETGQVARHLLAAGDIDVRSVDVAARNGAYVHDRRDGDREPLAEMVPDSLTRHEQDDLFELTVVAALDAGVAVLSGSSAESSAEAVSVSMYERLATDLAKGGTQVIVDLAGARLDAALAGKPAVVKVSHEELLRDGRATSDALPDLLAAAMEIAEGGVGLVVVSRAAEPALAVYDGTAVTVTPPRFSPVDTHGAGDSMTAGIAAAYAQGRDVTDALRLGAAAGALNVTRHGLGTGSGVAVRALTDRVAVAALTERSD